ncbi:MAG: Glu-tRNA(Gln) amidotransferase subunit GatE [Bacteroidales bacterium]|jgi:glutamyl-tRNA(Gln) amidotransferase subunit E|nr:Glu-tRNA(Gln) amidotransferase subunit GatE [Bacteroidales bacterium]
MKRINPRQNFEDTCKKIGYVNRKNATQSDYDRIGFMSGLEVHQQLLTDHKLFCHCPAGIFQKPEEFDAEVVRHMRPTLSELGEYDGTALMEFKTRKEIIYRLSHPTACTYEVDDTPPFHVDRQALDYAIEVALASKMSIVGEVHITRKQYLDGSIPTGFQRTAIIGIEGSIQLKNKTIRLIQMSLEEDACREVSDIGHRRVYRTDRLGMPLIETVTYPECMNPDELQEACNYIRFLNRSTGHVRTGIGAGREDVNVSCKGGTRVEIKGVAHAKWIPELSHNECFRQWALLAIRTELQKRIKKEDFKIRALELNPAHFNFYYTPLQEAMLRKEKLYAVNLPQFAGLLSHFTQPGKPFYDEFAGRLKVIACLEKPNMATSEDVDDVVSDNVFEKVQQLLNAAESDAQIIFWAPEADVKTAVEVIEERALMTFDGVPNETRKSFANGTTIFERVLPGADRMYPDTDSVPIPLKTEHIEKLALNVPDELQGRFAQLREWGVPEDCYNYLSTHNYFPLLKKMVDELGIPPKELGVFMGQRLKHLHGRYRKLTFAPARLYDLFACLQAGQIDSAIAYNMLKVLFEHPKIDFDSILNILNFKRITKEEIEGKIKFIASKFTPCRKDTTAADKRNYIMGQLRQLSEGNLALPDLASKIG